MEGATEKQEHAGCQHYVDEDIDCEFFATINLEKRNIVGERHADLADRLQLFDMPICKAASCVYFSKDVPSHCVCFALQVALDFSWDFVDAEEDQKTCSHSNRVRSAYVRESGYCRDFLHP